MKRPERTSFPAWLPASRFSDGRTSEISECRTAPSPLSPWERTSETWMSSAAARRSSEVYSSWSYSLKWISCPGSCTGKSAVKSHLGSRFLATTPDVCWVEPRVTTTYGSDVRLRSPSLPGSPFAPCTVSRNTKCGSPCFRSAMSTASVPSRSTAIRCGRTMRLPMRSLSVCRTTGRTFGKSAIFPAPRKSKSNTGGLIKYSSSPPKKGGRSLYGRKTTDNWPWILSLDTPTCRPSAVRVQRMSDCKLKPRRNSTSRLSSVAKTLRGPNLGAADPRDTSSKRAWPLRTFGK
mmetsp:Transcript_51346/g.156062  ORF Transcript_51346/g.156062 Transcript_51346/m.156062 type:complete len:291 (+) Transcript_51346:391-1263(+)